MKIIVCSSNEALGWEICATLGVEPAKVTLKRFADKEIFVEIDENVRGEDVFVIQSTNQPANDNLMELLIMLDSLRRASADRVTAVIPYYGYARQDRKTGPRTPISARLVADLISTAGAGRVLTMDLHAGQIQGFFSVPTDHLYAAPVLYKDIAGNERIGKNKRFVSPDVGGVARARYIASKFGCDLSIVDKRRGHAGASEVMNVIGDPKGQDCIIIDDIVDSAGTVCNSAQALMDAGANKVFVYASHGVFSPPAIERIDKSPIAEVVFTNSIASSQATRECPNIRQISVAELLGSAILRIHNNQSVSVLFD